MTIRVASHPKKEKIPSEQATEQSTMITPANPTTDLAWIMLEEQENWSLPSVSETYLKRRVCYYGARSGSC